MINLLINNQFSLPVRNARQENLKPGVRQDQGRVTPAQLRLAQPELPRYVGLDDAEGFAEQVGDEVAEPEEKKCQDLTASHGHLDSSESGERYR